MYDFFCERPASRPSPHSHFARVMNRLQTPHPLPSTDLMAPFKTDELHHVQFDDAHFLSDLPRTEHAVQWSSQSPDELFDETHVNPTRRNRPFVPGLPKYAGPMSDKLLDETYVNSARRNRDFFFFSDLPRHASPPGDELFF